MLRSALSGLGLGLAVAAMIGSGAASAQSAARIFRVGYIVVASPEEQAHLTRAFEDGMSPSSGDSPTATPRACPNSPRSW